MSVKKTFIDQLNEFKQIPISRNKKEINLYKKNFRDYKISIRLFNLFDDLDMLHEWVNQPYSKEFWGMHGDKKKLYEYYDEFLQSGKGNALLFYIDGNPVAFMEYYQVIEDELKEHYECEENDYGVHLLMAPRTGEIIPALSKNVMITCISFLFTLSINRIMGEPDIRNEAANELVRNVGFRFIKQIELSYKTANLYYYNKDDFITEHNL